MCNIELTEKRINHTWLLDSYELIPILLNKLINTENNKHVFLICLISWEYFACDEHWNCNLYLYISAYHHSLSSPGLEFDHFVNDYLRVSRSNILFPRPIFHNRRFAMNFATLYLYSLNIIIQFSPARGAFSGSPSRIRSGMLSNPS